MDQPVTPAPSRFLLPSKRQTQNTSAHQAPLQIPNETPNKQTAFGPHQFRATPRFSVPTAPRPSNHPGVASLGTATLRTPASRTRPIPDIIDDDGSPPKSSTGRTTTSPTDRQFQLPEPIEFDSSFVSQSPYRRPVVEDRHSHHGRSPKRRRISVASIASSESELDVVADSQVVPDETSHPTPIPTSLGIEDHILPDSSFYDDGRDVEMNDDDDDDEYEKHDSVGMEITDSSSPPPPPSSDQDEEDEDSSDHDHNRQRPKPQQPIFHKAPRFKPPDQLLNHHQSENQQQGYNDRGVDESRLPDIFSPQRRGPRYLQNGEAAELRSWLVQVKETELEGTHTTVRLVIEQVRQGGSAMTLVTGRRVLDGGQLGPSTRAILAGEGIVEDGLGGGSNGRRGKGQAVVPGAMVAVSWPVWDVALEEKWAVAYRWEVIEGGAGYASKPK